MSGRVTDPPARIDELLASARARLPRRPEPGQIAGVIAGGGLVVDIRPLEQRERDGELPGALIIDRNVLEWRLDPTCEHCIDGVRGGDQTVLLVCNEGYSSSLAAATLQDLGLTGATDLAGGFQAWLAHCGR